MHLPGSCSASSAFPTKRLGRLPALFREHDFPRRVFEVSAISLCSGLRVCLSPRSFLPLQLSLQGSRDVYVRAEHASLPSHASDILSARLQAIGRTRTFTSQDSQPCRLLTFRSLGFPDCFASRVMRPIVPAQLSGLARNTALGSRETARALHRATPYSIVSSRILRVSVLASCAAGFSFLPSPG